jgi:hypothetical protein
MGALGKALLRGWIRFGKILGFVQMSILLTLLWLSIVPLYALIAYFRDPLEVRAARDGRSMWRKSPHQASDSDHLWRPF